MRHLWLLPFAALAACTAPTNPPPKAQWATTYYDRNHDGVVDFELHILGRGGADADWALCDSKFRGRYDLRIHWGVVFEKRPMSLPVPKNVPITAGKPPRAYGNLCSEDIP